MSERVLHRELKFWEATALSVAIMAPTLAMGLNWTLPAGLVGENVPLVFLLAFAGVGLVAYGFVRLTRHFTHAGSAYALAGATLGPAAGFLAGWALLAVYAAFAVATVAATGLFFVAFLDSAGIWSGAPWLPIALLATVLVYVVASRDVRTATRTLIGFEAIAISLVVVLVAVILVRVIAGTPPGDQLFDLGVFDPSGVSLSAVLAATVFGFLSWAGFERAATLGDQTGDPRRNIPRAIGYAVGLTGSSTSSSCSRSRSASEPTSAGRRPSRSPPPRSGTWRRRTSGRAWGPPWTSARP